MNLNVNCHTPIQQTQQPSIQQAGQVVQANEEPSLTRKVCAATAGVLSGSATAVGYLVVMAIITSETQRSNPGLMTAIFLGAVAAGQYIGSSVNDQILGTERR